MSETMSQYAALMVMEREYGREQMRRFLKYELDSYLSARGGERRHRGRLVSDSVGKQRERRASSSADLLDVVVRAADPARIRFLRATSMCYNVRHRV